VLTDPEIAMITLKNITKKRGRRLVLNQVSFQLEKGQCAGLVGPNGAGKTTLLRVISTLLTADDGELKLAGLDPGTSQNRLKIREKVGYLDHESMLYSELTVEENLLCAGQMYFLKEDYTRKKVDHLLGLLKVSHRKHDPVKKLSRGMKQKVSIARTLLHEPEVLLFDEPLTGLDRAAVEVLKDILRSEKKKGKTIILASHKPEQLQELFDTVIHLDEGRVVKQETTNSENEST